MKLNLDKFILESIGNESFLSSPEAQIENEAREDIAMESAIDAAQEEAYVASLESVAADLQYFRTVLAERETNLAINVGRDASSVYGEFHIASTEAITDVAARHAYAGIANLKSLINKIISYLKNLLGFGTTIKKIASSLKLKSKKELKALAKYSGKDMSKLKRTMPKGTTLQTISATSGDTYEAVDKTVDSLLNIVGTDDQTNSDTPGYVANKGMSTTEIENAIKTLEENYDKLKDKLKDWKDDTEDYEESDAYSHVISLVQGISSWADSNKSNVADKKLAKAIKNMEKVREAIVKNEGGTAPGEKGNTDSKDEYVSNTLPGQFRAIIKLLDEQQKAQRIEIKIVIGQADEILTHSKAIQAAL